PHGRAACGQTASGNADFFGSDAGLNPEKQESCRDYARLKKNLHSLTRAFSSRAHALNPVPRIYLLDAVKPFRVVTQNGLLVRLGKILATLDVLKLDAT